MFPSGFWPGPQGASTTVYAIAYPALGENIEVDTGTAPLWEWTVTDVDGHPINLSGHALTWTAYTDDRLGTLVGKFQYSAVGGAVSIGGTNHNVVSVQFSASDLTASTPQPLYYVLQDVTAAVDLVKGLVYVNAVRQAVP